MANRGQPNFYWGSMIFRCILPEWAKTANPSKRRVYEGEFSQERIEQLNAEFYNIYFLPNYPSIAPKGRPVDGADIDTFRFVFVDMDLKEGKYESKEAFIAYLHQFPELKPTFIVDSGNGVHAYWQVEDLDAMSFLQLQRRLMRKFNTDEAVAKIYQLMRVPGTVNTKKENNFNLCEQVFESDAVYTCEQLDKALPILTYEDGEYCKAHFNKTYKVGGVTEVSDKLPPKFGTLLRNSKEVKDIWSGNVPDRSVADFRLGHIMFAAGFTRDEAMSVLVNSAKAITRAPVHKIGYAENIVDKIWTFEQTENKEEVQLSSSIKDILAKHNDEELAGTRFPCWKWIDDTHKGFRLGNVMGLVGGSGVGKTDVCLNIFMGFVELNPDYHHMFVSLEQPMREIAERWRDLCGDKTHLHDRVHVLDNQNPDGTFRRLSLKDIEAHVKHIEATKKIKIGCLAIDHIGVLKKESADGRQSIEDLCHEMKPMALNTNTFLIMQSQSPREKASIGDIELNKDAAYGTVYFESYCDYLVTTWQPLKRCYQIEGCPTVTALKFCKIRGKKKHLDKIQEDVCYKMYFNPQNGSLSQMTQDQEKAFDFFLKQANNKIKNAKKAELVTYTTIKLEENEPVKTAS